MPQLLLPKAGPHRPGWGWAAAGAMTHTAMAATNMAARDIRTYRLLRNMTTLLCKWHECKRCSPRAVRPCPGCAARGRPACRRPALSSCSISTSDDGLKVVEAMIGCREDSTG